MGGNAFKNKELSRINRENIVPTISGLVGKLCVDKLTADYVTDNFLGSVGKQATSGDIDVAICDKIFTFEEYRQLGLQCRDVLGEENALADSSRITEQSEFKSKQINTVVPIIGSNDFVQVDFIYGNAEWLKFSHYSPGLDRSPWKGVMISQTMGVLAKMKVFWRYPEDAVTNKDERLAEVACAYHLENGLRVTARLRQNGGFEPVDFDEFETKCPVVPPRVPRLGYITDPETAVRMIVGENVKPSDIETYEDLMAVVRKRFTDDEWDGFCERLVSSMMHSGAKKAVTREELEEFLKGM